VSARAAWLVAGALAVAIALVMSAGLTGLAYGVVYVAAVLPGIWFGRAAFGRDRLEGWFAGAALGYGATQLALWLPIFARVASPLAFIASWLLVSACFVLAARRVTSPAIAVPAAACADVRALALVMFLVPLLMGPPYRHLGAADEHGTRYYRAYFTADFVWHTALASELGKYDSPPRNPYYASQEMHYYWTYFLLPAVTSSEASTLFDVQRSLKANSVCTAALVLGLLLMLTRLAVPKPGLAAAAVILGVVASSAEGTYVLRQVFNGERTLDSVKELNIDAVSAWTQVTHWRRPSLRIDDLPRGFWYNPQHTFSSGLGLVAVIVATAAGAAAARSAILLAGFALGLSVCFNPFVGGIFAMIYAAGVGLDAMRTRAWIAVPRHALAAIPVAAGLGWCALNGVLGGTGAAVSFGLRGFARNQPFTALLLSAGPILLPAIAGLWPSRRLPSRPALTAASGALIALLLMHFVMLSEESWVGFRTGQILLLMVPVLVARFLFALSSVSRVLVAAACAIVAIAGVPTTVIDEFNTQDITNLRQAGEFPWTLTVTPAQQQAFAWIKTNTPGHATVQMEPILRGRAHWSLIPTFAERRMIAGQPISLLPMPEYQERSLEVQHLYQGADAREAWHLAKRLRIDYLYVDPQDRAAYPEGTAKFDAQPGYFEKAYDAGGVSFYRVR
jgi:hypothetical protein